MLHRVETDARLVVADIVTIVVSTLCVFAGDEISARQVNLQRFLNRAEAIAIQVALCRK
jgi:hypothetical protein